MSGALQNKLQQYEATPPPMVWERLSEQLASEFAVADTGISQKLDIASIAPPPQLWDKIAAELSSETIAEKREGKIIPLVFKRIAVAAIAIGLIALGIVYFTGNRTTDQPPIVNVPTQNTPPSQTVPPEKPQIADVIPTAPSEERTNTSSHKKNIQREPGSYAAIQNTSDEYSQPSPEQAPLYELSTVSALQPVSVSAPPLRDKTGNLILDLATISSPDDEYIAVTGPNGKQTKISSKFLSCLGYMNGNISASELDSKGIRCTAQFEEWRRRILSEPAFIPTANNFFDIFELKDLLQEM